MNKLFGLFLLALAFLAPVSIGQATLVNMPTPVTWPGNVGSNGGGPFSQATTTLTSAGHYLAFVLVAKEDMVISHVGVRAGTAAGSPTLTTTIETLDASGLPSGTLWNAAGGGSTGTTGTVTSNTNVLQALTASATVPKGSAFAVKIALASGTSQALNEIGNMALPHGTGLPYKVINIGAATKSSITNPPSLALGSNSTTFYNLPSFLPFSALSSSGFNNTNSAKRGMLFTIPMNCRIVGMKWAISNGVGDYSIAVYDQAGSVLSSSSTSFDGDITSANTNSVVFAYFANPVTLTAGTTYRVAVTPSTTTNTNVFTVTLPSTDYRTASPSGLVAQYTVFTTSTWDDTQTTLVPQVDILIDQLDDGAGTGGGGGRIIGG